MGPQGRALTGCDAPAGASGAQPAPLCASCPTASPSWKTIAPAGRYKSAPGPEHRAMRAPPGTRSGRLGRPSTSPCDVSCALLGSHSPQHDPTRAEKTMALAGRCRPQPSEMVPAGAPRIALCMPTGWAAGRLQRVVHKHMVTYTSNRHIYRRGTLWLPILSLPCASRPRYGYASMKSDFYKFFLSYIIICLQR